MFSDVFFAAAMALAPGLVLGALLLIVYWKTVEEYLPAFGDALRSSQYVTDSGHVTGYYFDADYFLADQRNVDAVTVFVTNVVRRNRGITALAFIEKHFGPVGLLSMKEHLRYATGLPSTIVRLRKRILQQAVKPPLPPEARGGILVVSDVGTRGSTVLGAVRRLRSAGYAVHGALVIYDRREGASERLAQEGIAFYSMDHVGSVHEEMVSAPPE